MATAVDKALTQIRALQTAPILPSGSIDTALIVAAMNALADAIESGAVPTIYDPTNPQKVT